MPESYKLYIPAISRPGGEGGDDFGTILAPLDPTVLILFAKGRFREGTFRRGVKEDLAQGRAKDDFPPVKAYIQRPIHEPAEFRPTSPDFARFRPIKRRCGRRAGADFHARRWLG